MVWLEILGQQKNPTALQGIEPETYRIMTAFTCQTTIKTIPWNKSFQYQVIG
jgi:hypothetical protein